MLANDEPASVSVTENETVASTTVEICPGEQLEPSGVPKRKLRDQSAMAVKRVKVTSQSNRLVVEAEVHLPVSDAERARHYRIRQREKKSQHSPGNVSTLSPGSLSDAERARQYPIRKRENLHKFSVIISPL